MPTHRYIGPTTQWGLEKNTIGLKIRRIGSGAGGGCTFIREGDGKRFTVNVKHVETIKDD